LPEPANAYNRLIIGVGEHHASLLLGKFISGITTVCTGVGYFRSRLKEDVELALASEVEGV
jgi:hypothetical protein